MATTINLGAAEALPVINVLAQAGREFSVTVQVLGGDGLAVPDGSVVSARAQVRPAPQDAQVVHVFSSELDPVSIEIDGATLTITATPAVTSGWQANWPTLVGWWDIEITDADDVPHQITAPGTITLTPEVTR